MLVDQEEVAVIEKDSYRLAVVNMDWNYVKAVDLYVVFNSFVPPNGMIKSVAVYPIQFGLQRMKEEDIRGPVLFDIEDEKSDEGNNDSSETDDQLDEKARKQDLYSCLVYSGNGSDEDAEHDVGQEMECSSDDDSDQQAIEEADEFFIEEPCVKKRKKAQCSKNNKDHNKLRYMDMLVVDKPSKEELELLLADETRGQKPVSRDTI
ncbi:hypothetical protein P8452_59835 [Trifolium repens]|nr:hypothetical protein P8452_59835 [Trifolium repens]